MKNILLLLLTLQCFVLADSYMPPEDYGIISENGKHTVRIEVGDPEKNIKPKAKIYKYNKDKNTYEYKKTLNLENDVLPPTALINNDATYLVTIDVYYGTEEQDSAISIYEIETKGFKHFKLKDFLTAGQIQNLDRSTSSILWRGEARIWGNKVYIDKAGLSENGPSYILDLNLKKVHVEYESFEKEETKKDRKKYFTIVMIVSVILNFFLIGYLSIKTKKDGT